MSDPRHRPQTSPAPAVTDDETVAAPPTGRGTARSAGVLGVTAALGVTAVVSSALGAPAAAAPAAAATAASTGSTATTPAAAAPTAAPLRTATVAAPVRVLTAASAATYAVRPGDTVWAIAARLGSSVEAIVAANGLDSRAFIRDGQVLAIPSGSAGGAAPAGAPAPAAAAGTHTTVPGDTVGAIAARYGSSVAAIVAANGLDARAFIRDGQVLTIPSGSAPAAAPTSAPASTPAAGTHTTAPGDTVGAIAARYGTSVAAIVAANGLDARAFIRDGQTLTIPGGSAAAPAASSAAAPSSAPPLPSTFAGRTYPAATVQAATANRDTLLARSVPGRDEMQQLIAQTAAANGVDPALAQAIGFQESGFNMRAVSPANAVGAMQVIPSSGEWASTLAGRPIDLLDPRDNALAGVLILKAHAARTSDQATVIGAYYQGMGSVTRNGFYSDTRRYVANVQTLIAGYR